MYKLAIKNAFLFIGAMIGAGFATGAELMVFFRAANIVTVILSAMLIGMLSMVFINFGKVMHKLPKLTKVLDIIMVINSIITFIAMQAGIEELFMQNFNVVGIGLLTAIFTAFLSAFSLDVTKKLNMLVIPIVIIMIFWLFSSAKPTLFAGGFKPMQAISYASMNLLLGGYLVAKDSQSMRAKHTVVMGAIIFIVIAIMMIIMLCIASLAPRHSMPIYEVALTNKLGAMACIIIYLAILTTIIGAGKVIAMGVNISLHGKWQGSAFLVALCIVTHGASFSFMVETFYPITGYVGIIVCSFICIIMILSCAKTISQSKGYVKNGLSTALSP